MDDEGVPAKRQSRRRPTELQRGSLSLGSLVFDNMLTFLGLAANLLATTPFFITKVSANPSAAPPSSCISCTSLFLYQLHPPLLVSGVSIVMEWGCQHIGSLADAPARPCSARRFHSAGRFFLYPPSAVRCFSDPPPVLRCFSFLPPVALRRVSRARETSMTCCAAPAAGPDRCRALRLRRA